MITRGATFSNWPEHLRFLYPLLIEGEGDGDGEGEGGSAGGEADGGDGGAGDEGAAGKGEGQAGKKGAGLTSRITEGEGGEGGEGENQGGDGTSGGSGEGDGLAPDTLTIADRPDWLPDQFHDAKTGEVKVQDLAKAWHGMREKVSRGEHKAPETAAGYKLEVPDTVTRADEIAGLKGEGGEGDGPVLAKFRALAHELGLSQDDAQKLYAGHLEAVEATMAAPMDNDAEMRKLGPKGQQILNGQATWLTGLKDKGIISEDQFSEAWLNLDTAPGIGFIASLRAYFEGYSIPDMIITEASGSDTADDLRAEMVKITDLAAQGDTSAQRKFEALEAKYEKLYGTKPAGSSARPAV